MYPEGKERDVPISVQHQSITHSTLGDLIRNYDRKKDPLLKRSALGDVAGRSAKIVEVNPESQGVGYDTSQLICGRSWADTISAKKLNPLIMI